MSTRNITIKSIKDSACSARFANGYAILSQTALHKLCLLLRALALKVNMQNSLVYTPTTHDYFDDLVALFISLAALETALTCYANRGIADSPRNPQNAIHLGGRIATHSVHTFDLMHSASNDVWPSQIIIYRFTRDAPPSFHEGSRDLSHMGLQRLVGSLVGSFFLKWYERHSETLKSRYGRDPLNWPDLQRFAWVLRNAIAHGDIFTIDNPAFPETLWREFKITAAQSGLLWFDLDSGFLGGGDVLELINELHAALN